MHGMHGPGCDCGQNQYHYGPSRGWRFGGPGGLPGPLDRDGLMPRDQLPPGNGGGEHECTAEELEPLLDSAGGVTIELSADRERVIIGYEGGGPGEPGHATDAELRDRSTHTGTQPIASVDGLQDALDERLTASQVTGGQSITVTETAAGGVEIAYSGGGDGEHATDAELRDRSTHTGTQPIASVDGLQAALDDKAATSHTHTIADTDGLRGELDDRLTAAQVAGNEPITVTAQNDGGVLIEFTPEPIDPEDLGAALVGVAPIEVVESANGDQLEIHYRGSSDDDNRNRANHTGSQPISSVTNLNTELNRRQILDRQRGQNLTADSTLTTDSPTVNVFTAEGITATFPTEGADWQTLYMVNGSGGQVYYRIDDNTSTLYFGDSREFIYAPGTGWLMTAERIGNMNKWTVGLGGLNTNGEGTAVHSRDSLG